MGEVMQLAIRSWRTLRVGINCSESWTLRSRR